MKAVCWQGKQDVRVKNVEDPTILNPRDAIVRVTSTAICGSDLHLYHNHFPTMEEGDIIGHEFMGEVVEVGRGVHNLRRGDRVVVPFPIACGRCYFCRTDQWSLCDNSNPNAEMAEAVMGYSGAGIYGYSHLLGGYAGGQAEYVRVPFADVGPMVVPEDVTDEQVLFLTDILPTGYQGALFAGIEAGDVVAVWGCGPVGQFVIRCAFLLGAGRVIAIDRFPERLRLAAQAGAEPIDYEATEDLIEELKQMTGGRGPDRCIDAVGMDAHGHSIDYYVDRAKQVVKYQFDRATVLRQAIQACRKGGTIAVDGVYAGYVDKFPFGVAFSKGLTIRGGQCHVHRYMRPLLEHIRAGRIDPTEIVTHRLPLDQAAHGYRIFNDKREECVKVVLRAG